MVKVAQAKVPPNTTTSLEAEDDIRQLIQAPHTAIQGEESLKGNGGSGGNTTWHLI